MPTLNFGTIRPAPIAEWLNSFVSLPIFSYSGIPWKGASEIVTQFNYTATKNFTLRELPTPPVGVNFCLVIRYRIGLVSFRYKLWSAVGEVLNEPLYNGEVIKKNFVLEIWTVQNTTNVSLATAINIKTSIRKIPDTYASLDEYADNTVVQEAASQNISVSLTAVPTTGLVAHYKNENILQAGGFVTSWVDSVGGFNLSPNVGSSPYLANAKNGYPGVQINSSSMQANNPFAGGNGIGIYAVVSQILHVAGRDIIHINTPTANDIQGVRMGATFSSIIGFMKLNTTAENLLLPQSLFDPDQGIQGNFDIIHFNSRIASQEFRLDVSGQGLVSSSSAGATMGTKLNIGTGDIIFLEILCYNLGGFIDHDDASLVYQYLLSKFGLGLYGIPSVNSANPWLSN